MRGYFYRLATDEEKGFVAGLMQCILLLFSFMYGLAVRIPLFIYRLKPRRLPCKVISVGNITLGGTGKTSLVELIARYLRDNGHKAAILSRGYKRKMRDADPGFVGYGTMGDEPYMLSMNLKDVPVLVDPDRIRAAKRAVREYGVDTVILDDGLQQWRIKKDLEIVTIDTTNPFGNRHLLPRGILRQPISSLAEAQVFVLTKTNLGARGDWIKLFLNRINPQGLVFESVHMPVGFYELSDSSDSEELLDINILRGKTVTTICGIGDPASFDNLIRNLGINIGLSFTFPDHYHYTRKDLENIIAQSRKKNIEILVTTQKDAIRINPRVLQYKQPTIFVLRIKLKIVNDEEGFYSRLRKLYSV
jgi:tetraacyldisaccharide 4'-kinase